MNYEEALHWYRQGQEAIDNLVADFEDMRNHSEIEDLRGDFEKGISQCSNRGE